MRGSLIARQVKRDKLSESLRIYRQFERQLCWPSTSKFVASSYNFSSLLLLPFTTVVLFITWEQVSEETKMVIACSSFAWVYTHCCAILVVTLRSSVMNLKARAFLSENYAFQIEKCELGYFCSLPRLPPCQTYPPRNVRE